MGDRKTTSIEEIIAVKSSRMGRLMLRISIEVGELVCGNKFCVGATLRA